MCRNPITRLSFDTLLIANLFQALFKESFGFNQSTTTCLRSQMVVTAIVHCPVVLYSKSSLLIPFRHKISALLLKKVMNFFLYMGSKFGSIINCT